MSQKTSHLISGVHHVAINVKSLDESLLFYRDLLGFEVLYQSAASIFLKIPTSAKPESVIALLETPAWEGAPPAIDWSKRLGNKFNHFGFRTLSKEAVDEMGTFLKEKGVRILKGPYDRSDGRAVYFLDPNDYTIEYFYLDESLL